MFGPGLGKVSDEGGGHGYYQSTKEAQTAPQTAPPAPAAPAAGGFSFGKPAESAQRCVKSLYVGKRTEAYRVSFSSTAVRRSLPLLRRHSHLVRLLIPTQDQLRESFVLLR